MAPGRTALFSAGLVVVVIATQSGLARYDTILFSAHAAQHVLPRDARSLAATRLVPPSRSRSKPRRPSPGTIGPCAAPSRGPDPGPSCRGVAGLRGGDGRALDSPRPTKRRCATAWSMPGRTSSSSRSGSSSVGPSPASTAAPGRIAYPVRLLLVLLTVPVHAVAGLALMSGSTVLAGDWYADLDRTWGSSPVADQHGGALLWLAGDLLTLLLAGIVMASWMQHEDRVARRLDRLGPVGARPGVSPVLSRHRPLARWSGGVVAVLTRARRLRHARHPRLGHRAGQRGHLALASLRDHRHRHALLIWGLVAWSVVRYRRRDDAIPTSVRATCRSRSSTPASR